MQIPNENRQHGRSALVAPATGYHLGAYSSLSLSPKSTSQYSSVEILPMAGRTELEIVGLFLTDFVKIISNFFLSFKLQNSTQPNKRIWTMTFSAIFQWLMRRPADSSETCVKQMENFQYLLAIIEAETSKICFSNVQFGSTWPALICLSHGHPRCASYGLRGLLKKQNMSVSSDPHRANVMAIGILIKII